MRGCKVVTYRLVTMRDFRSRWLHAWAALMQEPFKVHRKLWEYAAIVNVLDFYGLLKSGRAGLGFGVGTEPLVSLFAGLGADIVATDLPSEDMRVKLWAPDQQHAAAKSAMHKPNIVSWRDFDKKATFEAVDMTAIPAKFHGQFDFVWSCSSLEHLGSIENGLQFLRNTLECLKPGGLSIHTTEYCVGDNVSTLDKGDVVAFRRRDLESFASGLLVPGGTAEANWATGNDPEDRDVDEGPNWRPEPHLKLRLGGHVLTSVLAVLVKDDHA